MVDGFGNSTCILYQLVQIQTKLERDQGIFSTLCLFVLH